MKKAIDLTLPEWTWIDGSEHDNSGEVLQGRSIIYHVRSASVIEVLEADFAFLNEDAHTLYFRYGFEEFIAVLHYSATIEDDAEIDALLKRASQWYCKWCEWEDKNIEIIDKSNSN